MTLLIVGASGLLGGEVARQALAAGATVAGSYLRAPGDVPGVRWLPLDVRDAVAVRAAVRALNPSTVVNTAYAYHDWRTTADGAAHVALACAETGTRLIHMSSDVVHGGRCEPYRDDDPPSPITPYGAAKAAAETAVRAAAPAASLVRTSLILGDEHSQQIALCLDLITGRQPGQLFADEVRCPVDVGDLAAALLELAAAGPAGLINVAGPEAVSRVALGRLVAARYGLDPDRVPAITRAEAGVVRPGNVCLDSTRATGLLRTRLRPVSEVLAGPT